MGGVDRNQNVILPIPDSLELKNGGYLFMFMSDTAVQNAWLLYKKPSNHQNMSLDFFTFRQELVVLTIEVLNLG